jgi:hypothetical protein
MTWSGLENRAEIELAASDRGVRARFLVGRLLRGSKDVGMDSGIGSDIATTRRM